MTHKEQEDERSYYECVRSFVGLLCSSWAAILRAESRSIWPEPAKSHGQGIGKKQVGKFGVQVCFIFGCARLSQTGGAAVRSLSRAKPRDLDQAIEEHLKVM